MMQGVEINAREVMIAGTREPPLSLQEALTRELQMAFDDLPLSMRTPENKGQTLDVQRLWAAQAQSGQRLT